MKGEGGRGRGIGWGMCRSKGLMEERELRGKGMGGTQRTEERRKGSEGYERAMEDEK